ncbi:hypothetical protein A9Q86_01115 [Flavobacteriales bacterium 33_180_T64]|nr:hypothetical protein A9Q86_01115 [Flavobacteriales bacterium 33_180_T64]
MIYILSEAIRTGKTTTLLEWTKNRTDVDGVLCPDNEKGKRYFLKIKSKGIFSLEVETENINDIIQVGPFRFLKSAFEKANDFVISLTSNKENRYLIIDELGKLELKNTGLHASAKMIIPQYILNDKEHLILVVRESLLYEIIAHYDISHYSIIKKEDLVKLD